MKRSHSIKWSHTLAMGHRLMGHKGKCRNYHGHTYKFTFLIEGDLDENGMVVDFGDLKATLGAWLNDNLDHAMVLQAHDPMVETCESTNTKVFTTMDPPTAEHLAKIVHKVAENMLLATTQMRGPSHSRPRLAFTTCAESVNHLATYYA